MTSKTCFAFSCIHDDPQPAVWIFCSKKAGKIHCTIFYSIFQVMHNSNFSSAIKRPAVIAVPPAIIDAAEPPSRN